MRCFPVPDPYARYKKKVTDVKYIHSQFPVNMTLHFSVENGLPGFDNYKERTTFSTNNFGMRGDDLVMQKPQNEFRIFAVGGSTTECLYLDDGDDWPYLLQSKLNELELNKKYDIKIYNCGKSGANSVDHIELTAFRLVHLEPDAIIFYVGINDLSKLICDANILDLKSNTEGVNRKIPYVRFLLSELQLFRRFYYAFKQNSSLESITLKSNYREKASLVKEFAKMQPRQTELVQINLDWYERNLRSLVGICKSNNIQPIFVTQAESFTSSDSTLVNWHWMNLRCGNLYSKKSLHLAIGKLNNIMKKVAQQYAIPCFDAANALPPDTTVFYDDCHFNPNGSKLMADRLKDFILDNHILQKTNPTDN